MFLGRFDHAIDDKNRLTMPSRLRDLLENGAYLTLGFDKNLVVMPAAEFEALSNNIRSMSFTDAKTRILKRLVFTNAERIDFDRNGRFILPQFLREEAGLTDRAVIVGVGDSIEIWSPQHWEQQESEFSDSESNSERFADLNLHL